LQQTRSHALALALIDAYGADPSGAAPRSQYTPLGLAAYNGDAALVSALLARGADPRKANKWNETPRRLAAKQGHTTVRHIIGIEVSFF
jgi:ankyrin repeat protein